jgi:hypothetical protein
VRETSLSHLILSLSLKSKVSLCIKCAPVGTRYGRYGTSSLASLPVIRLPVWLSTCVAGLAAFVVQPTWGHVITSPRHTVPVTRSFAPKALSSRNLAADVSVVTSGAAAPMKRQCDDEEVRVVVHGDGEVGLGDNTTDASVADPLEAAVVACARVASIAHPPANAAMLEYVSDTADALASHPSLRKAQGSLPIDGLHVAAVAAEQLAFELCSNACDAAANKDLPEQSTKDVTVGIRKLSAPALYFELSRLVQSRTPQELGSLDAAALRRYLCGAFGGASVVTCSDAVLRKYFLVALEEHQMRESIGNTATRVGL